MQMLRCCSAFFTRVGKFKTQLCYFNRKEIQSLDAANATWLIVPDDLKVNRIYDLCRKRYLICNIADTPPLCDYLGGM
jgi:siroheme synthase (precorrin-2 oxidase/ferrochelatase)